LHAARAAALGLLGRVADAEKALALKGEGVVVIDDPLLAAVEQRNLSSQGLQQRAQAALAAGHLADGRALLERALEFRPESLEISLNLAKARLLVGDLEAAAALLESQRSRAADDPRFVFAAASLAAKQGAFARAEQLYRQLLIQDPQGRDALINLGNLLVRRGDPAGAAELFGRLVELEPRSSAFRAAWIKNLALGGNVTRAKAAAEAALTALPGDPGLLEVAARLLATDDPPDLPRARALAEESFRKQPSLSAVEALALIAAAAGDFATALDWQRQALAAARRAGDERLAETLARGLASFERGEKPRGPWPRG
jgi:thioredoxin-like negative regulator of GroEL